MITPAAAMAPVMPTIRPRTSGRVAGEGEAVLQRAEEGLLRLDRAGRPTAADRRQVPDDDRGDQEGQRVQVQREVDLVDARG